MNPSEFDPEDKQALREDLGTAGIQILSASAAAGISEENLEQARKDNQAALKRVRAKVAEMKL
jgi:hypothetical protein